MLGGNISNKSAPILAFNVDNLLFKDIPRDNSLLSNIKAKITPEKKMFLNREIDLHMVNQLNILWARYDYSIYLVTMHPEYRGDLFTLLDGHEVNFTSLVSFNSREELRDISFLQYTYYFDSDEELISFVGVKAQHIKELPNILK